MAAFILLVSILGVLIVAKSSQAQERIGCFSFNHDNTVLSVKTQDPVGSIKECIQQCQNRSATYAGIRNGFQCYCGDNHNHTVNGEQLDDSSCSTQCNDQTQGCGGQSSIVIYSVCSRGHYHDSTYDASNCDASCNCRDNHICLYPKGSCPVSCETGWSGEACNVNDQERIGCFSFNHGNTVLYVKTQDPVGSIEECIQQCKNRGATYAGIRYGYNCYCGDNHDHTVNGPKLNDRSCTTGCNDRTLSCGGQYSIVIFSVCSRGRYRDNTIDEPNCDASCNCGNNHICLYNTGSCPVTCKKGWTGEACNVKDMVTQSSRYEISEIMTTYSALPVMPCDASSVAVIALLAALCATSVGLVISIIVIVYLVYRLRDARTPGKQSSAQIDAIHKSADRNSCDTSYENMGGVQTEPPNYEQLGSRQTKPETYEELSMAGPLRG